MRLVQKILFLLFILNLTYAGTSSDHGRQAYGKEGSGTNGLMTICVKQSFCDAISTEELLVLITQDGGCDFFDFHGSDRVVQQICSMVGESR